MATRYPERNPFHGSDWLNSLPHLDRTVRAWSSAICAPLGQVSKLAPDLCPPTHISAVCTISSTVDPCPYFPYIKNPSSSPSPCSCPWFRRRTACVPASSHRGAVRFCIFPLLLSNFVAVPSHLRGGSRIAKSSFLYFKRSFLMSESLPSVANPA